MTKNFLVNLFAARSATTLGHWSHRLPLRLSNSRSAFSLQAVGLAFHIGARVAAKTRGGEILVSSAVKDLMKQSGIRLKDRGAHRLQGVPERERLYRVETCVFRLALESIGAALKTINHNGRPKIIGRVFRAISPILSPNAR